MAGLYCYVNSGEVTLVAATAKTLLQIKAPTNQRVLIKSVKLYGKQPAGGTDTPVKIRLTRSTANFGTGSGATANKKNPSNAETIQSTAFSNFTVEPTTPTDGGMVWYYSPQTGVIEPYGPAREIEIPGGQSIQLEATSPGTPIIIAEVDFEE